MKENFVLRDRVDWLLYAIFLQERCDALRKCVAPVFTLLAIALSGCNPILGLISRPTLTPTINYPSAPEPHGPNLTGTISGLPIGVSATIIARLPFSDGGIYGNRGNGSWEMEVLYEEGVQRKVIAQADGFSVHPAEYVIYFKEGKVFLVMDGIKTDREATDLVFVFSPSSTTKTP